MCGDAKQCVCVCVCQIEWVMGGGGCCTRRFVRSFVGSVVFFRCRFFSGSPWWFFFCLVYFFPLWEPSLLQRSQKTLGVSVGACAWPLLNTFFRGLCSAFAAEPPLGQRKICPCTSANAKKPSHPPPLSLPFPPILFFFFASPPPPPRPSSSPGRHLVLSTEALFVRKIKHSFIVVLFFFPFPFVPSFFWIFFLSHPCLTLVVHFTEALLLSLLQPTSSFPQHTAWSPSPSTRTCPLFAFHFFFFVRRTPPRAALLFLRWLCSAKRPRIT